MGLMIVFDLLSRLLDVFDVLFQVFGHFFSLFVSGVVHDHTTAQQPADDVELLFAF